METDSIRGILREFVRRDLARRSGHLEISDQDNLIGNGMIDSLGIIKTIHFLEERFRFTVRDEDVVPDNFETIEALSSFVGRMLNK